MPRRGPDIRVVAMILSMSALPVGCKGLFGESDQPTLQAEDNRSNWFEPPRSKPDRRNDRIVVVQMQFDVLRVELPADRIHHSAKVWNHVDELRGDLAQTALLRRNGLRIGVASADAWPALRAVFEACQAKVLRATHAVQQGLPLILDLGQVQPDETVFLFTADDRMAGTTFAGGHKYLHLDYELSLDAEGITTVQVTPEIHDLGLEQRWPSRGGEVLKAPEYQGRLFHELRCTVDVAAGEFLVIGPDAPRASNLTVGRRFLVRKHQGRDYETVLCITPQPFRTQAVKR